MSRVGPRRACFERDGIGVVPLPCGLEAIVDVDDLDSLRPYNWRKLTTSSGHRYAHRLIYEGERRATVLMHRVIMAPPEGMVVDHINGDGLDNRRANLRVCTQKENMRNQRMHRINQVGHKGVYLEDGRFRAQIKHEGRNIHLGLFDTANEAAAAYQGAAKALWGEFSRAA